MKGGMQFIFAMALPKWSVAELKSMKQMGGEYGNMHARVQACIRQVIQLVRWEDNSLKHSILGEPKVINLPIQCVEGDHQPQKWNTEGQWNEKLPYQKCVIFWLVSVDDMLERVAEAEGEVK